MEPIKKEPFELVLQKFDTTTKDLFRCALDWAEIRLPKEILNDYYLTCCKIDTETGKMKLVFLPDFFKRFINALLAESTYLPTQEEIKKYYE